MCRAVHVLRSVPYVSHSYEKCSVVTKDTRVHRYLSYALVSGKFGKQDIRVLIYIAKYNPFGGQLAWSFVRANWAKLVRR